jgi:hypothetical protein
LAIVILPELSIPWRWKLNKGWAGGVFLHRKQSISSGDGFSPRTTIHLQRGWFFSTHDAPSPATTVYLRRRRFFSTDDGPSPAAMEILQRGWFFSSDDRNSPAAMERRRWRISILPGDRPFSLENFRRRRRQTILWRR